MTWLNYKNGMEARRHNKPRDANDNQDWQEGWELIDWLLKQQGP